LHTETHTKGRCKATDRHTERIPCEDANRDWSNMSTNQRMPGIASNHQKLEEKHGRGFLPQSLHKERTLATIRL